MAGWAGNHNISSECFKTVSIGLHHGDGNMAGFTGVNISNGTRFSFMRATDY